MKSDLIALPRALNAIRRVEFPHKLGVCERFFRRTLAKNGICWVRTSAGPVWKLDLTNATHRWIVYGYYEGPAIFRWATRALPKNATIVDSGANIGQTVLYFGSLFPQARILAFEPGTHQADWFCECLVRNPAMPVKLVRSALGAFKEEWYLQTTGHPSYHGSQNVVSPLPVGEKITIMPLAEVLHGENLSHIDLWKLDVEGFELQALRGAMPLLEEKKIRALWVETRDNWEQVAPFLRDTGYEAYHLQTDGVPIIARSGCDYTLFIPNE